MKTKIEFFAICFVGILYAFSTKNSEVIFLGEGLFCYNYGFPLRVIITDPNNSMLHIYTLNIILNILLLFPIAAATLLAQQTKKYLRINKTIAILFCLTVFFNLFLTWEYKKTIYCCSIVFYVIWLNWFIFLIWRYFAANPKMKFWLLKEIYGWASQSRY